MDLTDGMKCSTVEVEARAQGLGRMENVGQFSLAHQKGGRKTSDWKDSLGLSCGIPLFRKIAFALGRESREIRNRVLHL